MIKRHIFLLTCIITLTTLACKKAPSVKTGNGIDLLKYGIADKVYPPDNAVITPNNTGKLTGLSISTPENLQVNALMTLSYTQDFNKLIQDRKREIVTDPFFVKIVEESDKGFLFEKQVSPTSKAYDFRIIKLIGDNEVTYQCGINKEYTEAEAKTIMSWVNK